MAVFAEFIKQSRVEEISQDEAKRARSPTAQLPTARATSRCFNAVLRNLFTREKKVRLLPDSNIIKRRLYFTPYLHSNCALKTEQE